MMSMPGLRLPTDLLAVATSLLVLAAPTPTTPSQAGDKEKTFPHLVVLMADDLGWSDVGYRDPEMVTPHIDRLAREGVTLNYSYMQQVCTPSRAAFLSGYYPFRLGLQNSVLTAMSRESLPLEYRLLPEELQALGYSTHLVGKWHLGFCRPQMTPTYRGFDSFYGMYTGKADYFTHTSKRQGYDLHHDVGHGPSRNFSVDWAGNGTYSTHLYADRAVDIVNAHDPDKPLFLFLSFQAVHGPTQVPPRYVTEHCAHVTSGDRKLHCAMTAAMDEGVGKVMAALEARGFSDNLITLFVSDNGGAVMHNSSNWPLRGSKSGLWEGGTRVVTVLHSQSYLPGAPATWDGLMHAVDWYPTLMGAVGMADRIPEGLDGVNLWEDIVHLRSSGRTGFVYNIDDVKHFAALRDGPYKLIRNSGGKIDQWYNPPAGVLNDRKAPGVKDYFLFNIHQDPEELHDLSEDPEHAQVVRRLKAKLKEHAKEMVPSDPDSKSVKGKPSKHGGLWTTGWC